MIFRDTAPRSTRRGLIAGALAAGAGMTLPRYAFAQEGTPEALHEPVVSQKRDAFRAEIEEVMGYTVPPAPGGTFIDSNINDIQTIHPLLADDASSLAAVGMMYDQLIGGDIRTGGPAPNGLADYWEIAGDERTYTFHLSQVAKWHDGTDITADDVEFSFDALANKEVGSSYTQSFLDAVESWRAVDEHTFEVVAKEPLFTFLYDIVSWIIPKHIWESVPVKDWRIDGGATGQDPARVVGSGPWKFGEWRQGESISFTRNEDYYGKVPYLESYVIRIWPDQTSVVNALLNGELDATGLEPADVASVKATPGLVIANYPTRSFSFYMTNLDPEKTKLFQDVEVRKALLYGLDRDSIVHDILLDNAIVAQGTQPVISYAYDPERITTKYTFDPEKAKSLLAEAGWTDGDGDGIVEKDGTPLAFELLYSSGSPTVDQLIAYLQDAWKGIGVSATPRAMEFSAMIEVLTGDHIYEMALLGFSWNATFIQDAMFACNQYEGGFNMVKYCNPELDKIFAETVRTFDEEPRVDLIIKSTNIINDELPVTVMHFSKANVGYSERLQNFKPSAWGTAIDYVWIDEG